jgi:exonuclease III
MEKDWLKNSLCGKSSKIGIGSQNLQGKLASKHTQDKLLQDMKTYKVHIIALQETKSGPIQIKSKNGDIISFDSKRHKYGLGFAISEHLRDRILHTNNISGRIATLKINIGSLTNNHNICTIINVYAPTTQISLQNPQETQQFYKDLQAIYERNKNSGLIFILGDFNAHVGKPVDTFFITHTGKHVNGKQNNNGATLLEFVKHNNLFVNNSYFQHSTRHITTWSGHTTDNRPLHTQIDYIVSPHRQRFLFQDCRVYNGTQTISDHSLLVGRLFLDKRYAMRYESRISETTEGRWRRQTLINDPAQQKTWHDSVTTKIAQYTKDTKPDQLKWEQITSIYQTALSQVTVPKTASNSYNHAIRTDIQLQQLATAQHKLRLEIYNQPHHHATPHIQQKKTARNDILHKIRDRLRDLKNKELDTIAEEMESTKSDSKKCFDASRRLLKSDYLPFTLEDSEGNTYTNASATLPRVTTHYTTFFAAVDSTHHRPEPNYRPLQNPINLDEVTAAIATLKLTARECSASCSRSLPHHSARSCPSYSTTSSPKDKTSHHWLTASSSRLTSRRSPRPLRTHAPSPS